MDNAKNRVVKTRRPVHVTVAASRSRVLADDVFSLQGRGCSRAAFSTNKMDEDRKRTKHQPFRLGDTVRILSGPFVSFTGKIDGINQSKALLKVTVAIYGRTQPIRLNFADVEVVRFTGL